MDFLKDTRLFFAREKYAGIYELKSPLVPITVKNLRDTWNSIKRERKLKGRNYFTLLIHPNSDERTRRVALVISLQFLRVCTALNSLLLLRIETDKKRD